LKTRDEIILMTKLAIYDKDHGHKDKLCDEHFRADYIYKKNMWTRFYVTIACLIIIALDVMNRVIVEQIDIFSLDLKSELSKYAVNMLIILLAYTFVGSLLANKDYNLRQARLKKYFGTLSRLDKLGKQSRIAERSNKEDLRHGEPTYDKRGFN